MTGAGEPDAEMAAAFQAAAQASSGVMISPDGVRDLQAAQIGEPMALPEGPAEHSKHTGGDDAGYAA